MIKEYLKQAIGTALSQLDIEVGSFKPSAEFPDSSTAGDEDAGKGGRGKRSFPRGGEQRSVENREVLKINSSHLIPGELSTDIGREEFIVEYPGDLTHGDLSSNVAMVHAKALKQNPKVLAEKIVEKLKAQNIAQVEKIEIAGPGFINFYLTREFFSKSVQEILKQGENFGKNHLHKDQKIMVEYTDPNPFKQFHIGHLMSNAVGESLSRLIQNSGAEVKRATYGGDVGLHVAKGIWGLLQEAKKNSETDIEYLGRAYVLGSEKYETDEKAKQEIQELNKKVFEQSDPEISKLHAWGKKISLEHFHEIYKKLNSHFDFEFFESEMAPMGMFLVEEFLAKGVFEKSEGAIVFKGEQYGLHTRVFVNSQGLPTYETKELGLNKKKHELYPFDQSIIVTANEQTDYFRVLLRVMTLVYPDIANRTRHVSHGMLRFAEGKMSSRKGNIITGESLILDVEKLVEEKIAERELSAEEKKYIKSKVAIAAIKYSILKQSIGSDIIFDPEKSLSFEGDSGPYLQYATVRSQSILSKAEKEGIEIATKKVPEEISGIEKILFRFPDVVERATAEFAPQHIVTYLIELAGAFNAYYAHHQIVNAEDEYSSYKVALTQSFVLVMKNGLQLLGIQVPEKM